MKRTVRKAAVAAVICASLAALTAGCAATSAGAPEGNAWVTSGDRTRLMAPMTFAWTATPETTTSEVVIDAAQTFQSVVGFGAAVTDASAYLIQERLTETQRRALLRELFGRDDEGLGFDFTRVTIGASDFSRAHYSLADDASAGVAGFSAAPMAPVFATVRQARAINPELKVMSTPWSAPGWMKTTGSMIQGQLKPEYYATYADYLTRYIAAAAAEGVPTDYISIQNEPDFEPDSYPGMRWGYEGRARFIGHDLGPRLQAASLETKILDWDHNWDKPEQPLGVLDDATARRFVSGVAWHCYAGEVETQGRVRDAHPDKDVFFTECSGGDWAADFADSFVWTMRTLIIGSTENWARGVLMWNLALDETHGPHAGGCGDCRGVVTIDSRTGAVERNQEYYAFGHASRFVRQGARRVAVTTPVGLDATAFVNPDGGRVLLVLNGGDAPMDFAIGEGERRAAVSLPARSAATYVWNSETR